MLLSQAYFNLPTNKLFKEVTEVLHKTLSEKPYVFSKHHEFKLQSLSTDVLFPTFRNTIGFYMLFVCSV